MTITEIINNVLAGGLLGSLGQGIRLAVGLKKLNAENTKNQAADAATEPISGARIILSIFMGFIAGALGMIVKGASLSSGGDFSTESIITIIAIGYSGADFIEGVFNTYLTKFNSTAPTTTTEIQKTEILKTVTNGAVVKDEQIEKIINPDEDIVG